MTASTPKVRASRRATPRAVAEITSRAAEAAVISSVPAETSSAAVKDDRAVALEALARAPVRGAVLPAVQAAGRQEVRASAQNVPALVRLAAVAVVRVVLPDRRAVVPIQSSNR